MKVLTLDPSSTCIGYAVLIGLESADLCDTGTITPPNKAGMAAPAIGLTGAEWANILAMGHPAIARTMAMLGDVSDVVAEHRPDVVVVEIPSGKAGTGSKRGAKASLAVYGLAAGVIYAAATCFAHEVSAYAIPVDERTWTKLPRIKSQRGDPKAGRQFYLQAVYPGQYDPDKDRGCDAGDAILIARWWFLHLAIPGADPLCDRCGLPTPHGDGPCLHCGGQP